MTAQAAARTAVRQKLLIAVGPQAREQAEADRRATGKELLQVDSWQDAVDTLLNAAEPAASALVVAPGEELTYGALEKLLDASVRVGTPVGVLTIGRDGRLLGAGREPAPPAPELGAMYCHFRNRYDCAAEFGREQIDDFLKRLSGGVEAAVFHVHGNGADLQLGNQVMCVQVDGLRGKAQPGDLTLPCQVGGACRLEHLSLTTYWGASAMRARIAVLVSCWGYHPADGVLNPELLFGTALFRGSHVEAFIASTRVTFNTPELTQAALAFLELGGTAGELTMLLNRFPGTATPPYVCIGDPDVRVQVPDGARPARHRCEAGSTAQADGNAQAQTQAPVPAPDGVDFQRLSQLEAATRHAGLPADARGEIMAGYGPVLKEGRRAQISAETLALADAAEARGVSAVAVADKTRRYRALSALVARHTRDLPQDEADAFWDLVHSDPPAEQLDEQWCQVQTRLLRRRGPEQLGYLSSGSVYRDERLESAPNRTRHLCGNRMFRITVEFTAVDGYLRELAFCERCGPVADVPAGVAAPFLVADHDGVRVLGGPWDSAWVTTGVVPVGFSLLPASPPRLLSLAEPIPLPADLEYGRRLGVALVHGGEHILLEVELPHDPPPGGGGPDPDAGPDRTEGNRP
jgi:hypothetical protein